MILKPKHFTKFLSIMRLTGTSFGCYSKYNDAYRPIILSKWFQEIRTFKYEDHYQTLAKYIQKEKIKQDLVERLTKIDTQLDQDKFKKDYDDLMKEYFTEGTWVNRKVVYTQQRFINETLGKQNDKIKFFPTSFTTTKIFEQAKKSLVFEGSPFNNLFTGSPGISKSFSFFFLIKISDQINRYKFQKRVSQEYKKLLEADLLSRIPKFIYWNVPINSNCQDSELIEILKSQFSQLNDNKEEKEIEKILDEKKLSIFIQKVKEFYKKKDIQIVPIIDQINVFLKMKREWIQLIIKQNHHQKNKTQFIEKKSLGEFYNRLYNIFYAIKKNMEFNYAGHCFFICSSMGQIRLMGQDIQPYSGLDQSYYSSLFVVTSQKGHYVLRKTQMSFLKNFYQEDKGVQIQLLNYLIFQFDQFNNLKKNDKPQEKKLFSSLRQFLDDNQDFKKELQRNFKLFRWIPSQTTFLLIREMLSKKAKKIYKENIYPLLPNQESTDHQLNYDNSNQTVSQSKEGNLKKVIMSELHNLFNQMQQKGQQSLIQKIKDFIKKDQLKINDQRVSRMQKLNTKAMEYMQIVQQFRTEEQQMEWIQQNFKLVQEMTLKEVLKKEYYSKDFFVFEIQQKKTIIRPIISPEILVKFIWPQIVYRYIQVSDRQIDTIKNLKLLLTSFVGFEDYLISAFGNINSQSLFYKRVEKHQNLQFSFKINSQKKTYTNLKAKPERSQIIGQRFESVFKDAQKKIGSCEFYIPTNQNQTQKHSKNSPVCDMLFVKYFQGDQSSDYKTKIIFYTVDATIDMNNPVDFKMGGYFQYMRKVNIQYKNKTKNWKYIIVNEDYAVQFVNIVIGINHQTTEIQIYRPFHQECYFYTNAYYFNIKKGDIKFSNGNYYANKLALLSQL